MSFEKYIMRVSARTTLLCHTWCESINIYICENYIDYVRSSRKYAEIRQAIKW